MMASLLPLPVLARPRTQKVDSALHGSVCRVDLETGGGMSLYTSQLTLRSDGSATFRESSRNGQPPPNRGHFEPRHWSEIVHSIDQSRFWRLPLRTRGFIVDAPGFRVTVRTASACRTVESFGGEPPPALQNLRRSLDAFGEDSIVWATKRSRRRSEGTIQIEANRRPGR